MKKFLLSCVGLLGFFLLLGSVGCPEPVKVTPDGQQEAGQEPGGDASTGDAGKADQVAPDTKADGTTTEPPQIEEGPDLGPDLGPDDGGADATPSKVEPGKWTWIDVPGSKCGYGSQTGFALNPSPDAGAKRLFIYLQGGGACWKSSGILGNCFGPAASAVNLKGYDKSRFASERTINAFFFQRGAAANLFKNDHYAFIPYCSGDVFSGDNTLQGPNNQTMHFRGHANMKAFLTRIVAAYPNVKEVILSGSSAGAFGASNNWGMTQQMFGDEVKVHLINDSGPPVPTKPGTWEEWTKAWKFVPPPGCTDCLVAQTKILDHYKTTLLAKDRKMAFLTYTRDGTIRAFFGYGSTAGAKTFEGLLNTLFDDLDKQPNAQYYSLDGTRHTLLGNPAIKNEAGIVLGAWIAAMINGDAAWKSYRK